ncbi:MAG: hypothetical protein M1820_004024 [Bogoriella megaspora]|nr:MAG: hypothetical protein M1820_004024 [Bogoriella megaspora]
MRGVPEPQPDMNALVPNTPVTQEWPQVMAALQELQASIKNVDSRIAKMDKRVAELDMRVAEVRTRFTAWSNSMDQGLTALQEAMNAGLITLENNTNTRFTKVESHFTTLERSLKPIRQEALAHNELACRTNAHTLVEIPERLKPLRSLATNAVIVEFPNTVWELDHLSSAKLDSILMALEKSTEGSLTAKKTRLRWAVGVYNNLL